MIPTIILLMFLLLVEIEVPYNTCKKIEDDACG